MNQAFLFTNQLKTDLKPTRAPAKSGNKARAAGFGGSAPALGEKKSHRPLHIKIKTPIFFGVFHFIGYQLIFE